MSSTRSNVSSTNRTGRPPIVTSRSTASPLTPKLAANNAAPKRAPSPQRPPFVRGATTTPRGTTRSPSPTKNIITPARSTIGISTTPSSSFRSSARGGSVVSTPTPGGHTTPSSLRAKSPPVRPHVAGYQTPTGRGTQSGAPAPFVRKAGNTGDVARSSPLARVAGISAVEQPGIETVMNDKSAMFFHASEVKPQEPVQRPPLPKKTPTFVYANGREEDQEPTKINRDVSPAVSSISDRRTSGPSSHLGDSTLSPALTSPPLSAVSSNRSPLFLNLTTPSNPLKSPSPQAMNTKSSLNTPSLTVPKLRTPDTHSRPAPTPSPAGSVNAQANRKGSIGSVHSPVHSPSRHGKSASVSATAPESPSVRKRSATWAEAAKATSPVTATSPIVSPSVRFATTSPILPRPDLASSNPGSPILGAEIVSSPTKEKAQPDFAADARRERKVLDLEISNSSLLAINRSLEREIKKQKTELKRYRRLSRAGHFNLAVSPALPSIDASTGRPSSPFEEEVSELSESESESEDGEGDGSDYASNDAIHRAKDEERLRRDLKKHRDLILDTARMNRSLQRCLAWTEDLIKDGKKALDHQVKSTDIQIGGRILDDDIDDEQINTPATEEEDEEEDANPGVEQDDDAEDDLAGVEAFMGLNLQPHIWEGGSEHSADFESPPRTDRDSGIEIQKLRKCSRSPAPRSANGNIGLGVRERGSLGETF